MTLEKLLKIEEEFIVVQKAFIEAREQYEALSQTLRKAEREYIRGVLAIDKDVEKSKKHPCLTCVVAFCLYKGTKKGHDMCIDYKQGE